MSEYFLKHPETGGDAEMRFTKGRGPIGRPVWQEYLLYVQSLENGVLVGPYVFEKANGVSDMTRSYADRPG